MLRPILIDGQLVAAKSNAAIEVRNPATLAPLDSVPECGGADIDAAVTAARKAQPAWWRIPGVAKAELLHAVAGKIRARHRPIATMMTRETGKPLIESIDCVQWVAECFDYFAEVGRSSLGLTVPSGADHQQFRAQGALRRRRLHRAVQLSGAADGVEGGASDRRRQHRGVQAAAPESAVGPALGRVLRRAAAGRGQHRRRRRRRRQTADRASRRRLDRLHRLDRRRPTDRGLGRRATEEGQSRAGRHRSADRVRGCRSRRRGAGRGVGATPQRGPAVHVIEADLHRRADRAGIHPAHGRARQDAEGRRSAGAADRHGAADLGRCRRQDRAAGRRRADGGREAAARRPAVPAEWPQGPLFQPTVVAGMRHGGIATSEELFGPVVSIFTAKDAGDAIRKANDSEYGLGASIYTKSLELAMKAMDGIKAGSFWINHPLADNNAAPFGGMRASGIGRELGAEGLDAFREPKHVHLDYVQERKRDWFPYAERKLP